MTLIRITSSHYSSFSTLLRSTFDEALPRFADESIDLLHLDGHHTEEAVWHDLESWLPKLRPGGILLMHDVTMRGRGFGVWKVWEELLTRGRGWTFESLPGLGSGRSLLGNFASVVRDCLLVPLTIKVILCLRITRHCFCQLQAGIAQQWADGSIRSAPMASETVIQVFWTGDGNYREETPPTPASVTEAGERYVIDLPLTGEISGLRIDFYSALTRIDISPNRVRSLEWSDSLSSERRR